MRINVDLIALALGQTLVWAGVYYLFPAMLLQWEQGPGWSRAQLTGAFTLCLFMSALASPLTGRIIDQGYGPQLMFACTLLSGGCVGFLAQVHSLWVFYALWAVIGLLMAGCLYEPCFALLTRARGVDAKRSIIHVTLIAGFAGSLSFPAAHYLSEQLGWRTTTLVFSFVVMCLAAPLMGFGARSIEKSGRLERALADKQLRSLPTATQESSTAQIPNRGFLHNPSFWYLGIGFSLAGMLHGVTLHHLLPLLQERGFDAGIAVLAASFIGPSQVAGRLIMMVIASRLSNHAVAVSCFVLIIASIIALIATRSSPALLWLFVPLFGSGYGIVSIIRPVIARDILGEQGFGAKSGSLALLYLTGAASAPWLGSVVWRSGGYSVVLLCLLGLGTIGGMLYQLAHRSNRQSTRRIDPQNRPPE